MLWGTLCLFGFLLGGSNSNACSMLNVRWINDNEVKSSQRKKKTLVSVDFAIQIYNFLSPK